MSNGISQALPAAILDTILGRLSLLFLSGAGGDTAAARLAARQMLAIYQPETEDEFRLAAQIVSFSFHALEALSQAASPDMPLTRILRLRSSAVSLTENPTRPSAASISFRKPAVPALHLNPPRPTRHTQAPRPKRRSL
jgi:hypothetical protein